MQISNETLGVLKNFATINSNLIFRPGNKIGTMSAGKNIFALASVAENFPKTVPVYDLNSLLALLTLNDKCDVEFGDESLKIGKNGAEFEYFYSDERLVIAPPVDKSIEVDSYYVFTLSAEDVQTMQKAIAITASPNIFVTRKDNQVTLSIKDSKNSRANSYKKSLGESEGPDFNIFIGVDIFKIIPDAYAVTVSKKKFLHFKHQTKDLQYWLACDPGSTL